MPHSHPINIPYMTLLPIPLPSQKCTEIPRPLPPSPSAVPFPCKACYWEATTRCPDPSNQECSTSNSSRKYSFLLNRQVFLQIEKTLALLDGTGTNDLSLCMCVAEHR